ncbi:DUF421 domain-containing protein [Paenibacillaceae bacterium]|nr:DUF421 domain-containing protein [Paenibacillaceae bacterium]
MPMWGQIIIRSLGALIILFLMTRILGKKQISQLSLFEYVLGITLGELAGFISTDIEAHYSYGLIALSVWFLVPFSVEWLTLKSKRLRNWFDGKGRVMIKGGKVMETNLLKERLTADELLEQLRGKSVFNVADVEFAVMETTGELSVLLKKDKQPLTASDLGARPSTEVEPQVVIMDGNFMDEPLVTIGVSQEWVEEELKTLGLAVEDVFLGQVDAYRQLYVDLYDDQKEVPAPAGKALLLTSIKKIQADLELFAEATRDKRAMAMYKRNAETMEQMIVKLTPVLRRNG